MLKATTIIHYHQRWSCHSTHPLQSHIIHIASMYEDTSAHHAIHMAYVYVTQHKCIDTVKNK